MPRNRVNYQSEVIFVGPAPATGYHFLTGTQGTDDVNDTNRINQLHRIQSISTSFNINRRDINQFGELAAIDNIILSSPTVNLNVNYLLNGFQNERNVGLSVNAGRAVLSGLLDLEDDSRNFFIKTTPEGTDAISPNQSGTDIGVIGIGNAHMTSYSSSASIGNLATASMSFEGMNMVFDTGGQGLFVPAIFPDSASPVERVYSLPEPSGNPDGEDLDISAFGPSDIQIKVYEAQADGVNLSNTANLTDEYENFGVAVASGCIQGYSYSFDLPRRSIEELGSHYSKDREILGPVPQSLSVDLLVGDITTGRLDDLVKCDESYTVHIKLKDPRQCFSGIDDKDTLAQYELKNIKLNSISYDSSIGGQKSATVDFAGQIGGARQPNIGLFLSDTQAEPGPEQIPGSYTLCAYSGDTGYQILATSTGGYDGFQCYDVGDTVGDENLYNIHSGWSGAWVSSNNYSGGTNGLDTINSYATGESLVSLNGGTGYTSDWVITNNYSGLQGEDTIEDYATGTIASGTNQIGGLDIDSGAGWTSGWYITDSTI
tara:strand:+ start:121469 stop:123100 length:1632 start_codon:yes stop_codon:yes gene_type:complete